MDASKHAMVTAAIRAWLFCCLNMIHSPEGCFEVSTPCVYETKARITDGRVPQECEHVEPIIYSLKRKTFCLRDKLSLRESTTRLVGQDAASLAAS
jgi:hypothetical protein